MRSKAVIVLVFALSGLLMAACEDVNPSLVVESVVYPSQDCSYSLDSTLEISKGVFDAHCAKDYSIDVRVRSLMRARADITRPRAEPNVVQFESAEVQLSTLQGDAVAPKFSTPVYATIQPGDSSKPGKALVSIELIPAELVSAVQDARASAGSDTTITATVTLFGTTVGGTDVQSDPFSFPIFVCDKCLTLPCTLSTAQQTWFDALTTCQNGTGYNTAYCQPCN